MNKYMLVPVDDAAEDPKFSIEDLGGRVWVDDDWEGYCTATVTLCGVEGQGSDWKRSEAIRLAVEDWKQEADRP